MNLLCTTLGEKSSRLFPHHNPLSSENSLLTERTYSSPTRKSLIGSDHPPLHSYGRDFQSRDDFIRDSSQGTGFPRTPSIDDARHTRSTLYQTASSYPGTDNQLPLPGSSFRPAVVIENDSDLRRYSYDSFAHHTESPTSQDHGEYEWEDRRRGTEVNRGGRYHTRKRPLNPDEFDGPSQYLPLPLPQQDHSRIQELVKLPIHLTMTEQDEVMRRMNDILAECAFHFVAKYQFPIPLERSKPRVRSAADREWAEWAHLIKRLATKRRIPARVLYDNQIRQLVTTLEHSVSPYRPTPNDRAKSTRVAHDDRYILQLLSAGTQVAKLLMDSLAMQQLNDLYAHTENVVMNRRYQSRAASGVF